MKISEVLTSVQPTSPCNVCEVRKCATKKKKVFESLIDFLLCEMEDIPKTQYGYWIMNDGKIIPVNDAEGHVRVLKFLGRTPSYSAAFDDGWIRVAIYPTVPDKHAPGGIRYGAINFETGTLPTAKAMQSAIKVVMHHGSPGMYYNVDVNDDRGQVVAEHMFDKQQRAVGYFKSAASKSWEKANEVK